MQSVCAATYSYACIHSPHSHRFRSRSMFRLWQRTLVLTGWGCSQRQTTAPHTNSQIPGPCMSLFGMWTPSPHQGPDQQSDLTQPSHHECSGWQTPAGKGQWNTHITIISPWCTQHLLAYCKVHTAHHSECSMEKHSSCLGCLETVAHNQFNQFHCGLVFPSNLSVSLPRHSGLYSSTVHMPHDNDNSQRTPMSPLLYSQSQRRWSHCP